MLKFFQNLFAPIERTLPTHPSCPPHGCPLCLHDLPCVNLVAEGANCEPPEPGWLRPLRHETEMARAKIRTIRAETEAIRKETQSIREQTEIIQEVNKRLEELKKSGELKEAIQADIHRRALRILDHLRVKDLEEISPHLAAWLNSSPEHLFFSLSQDKTHSQTTMVPSNTPQHDPTRSSETRQLFEATLTFKAYVLAEDADAAIRCATDSTTEITLDYDPSIQVQPCQSNTLGWDPEWHVFHEGNSFISLREVMPNTSPCDKLSDSAPTPPEEDVPNVAPYDKLPNGALYDKLIETRAKLHLEECEKEMNDPASRGYSTSQQAATFLYLHRQIQDIKRNIDCGGATYEEMRLDEQQERRSQYLTPTPDNPGLLLDPRLQSPLVTRLQGVLNCEQGALRKVPQTHPAQALKAALSMAAWLDDHGFGNAARFIERELQSPRKP